MSEKKEYLRRNSEISRNFLIERYPNAFGPVRFATHFRLNFLNKKFFSFSTRAFIEGRIFTSRHWITRKSQRNIITFKSQDGRKEFGEVIFYARAGQDVAVIEKFSTRATAFSGDI